MIRPIGILLSILIISLGLKAQNDKADPKFIIGGAVFGDVESRTRNVGLITNAPDETIITEKNTVLGFQPYILFGSHPKRKFGLGLRSTYNRSSIRSNLPDIFGSSNESLLRLGLDLLYRKTLLKKNNLELFAQSSIGSDLITTPKSRTISNIIPFNIQSEIEFGATFQIAKSWNLLLSLPVIEFRFQEQRVFFSSTSANIFFNDYSSRVFNLNTSFTNLNLGIEKTF